MRSCIIRYNKKKKKRKRRWECLCVYHLQYVHTNPQTGNNKEKLKTIVKSQTLLDLLSYQKKKNHEKK